jgi:hypothetical protein
MTHDVFISHSSKDKTIADAICAALEAEKIRCWVAPRDILPGDKWAGSITKAISSSRIMVLIFSEHSNNSEDVLNELLLAKDAGAIIIPLKVGNIIPKGEMEYYLKRTHWLDALDPPTEKQIQQLVETVFKFIKDETDVRKETQTESTPHGKTSLINKLKIPVILSLIIIIAALIIFSGILSSQSDRSQINQPISSQILSSSQAEVPVQSREILSLIGTFSTSRALDGIFVKDKITYLANGGDGLVIIDTKDASKPELLGQYKLENAKYVHIKNNIAYVIQEGIIEQSRVLNDKLVLIDVSMPTNPTFIGDYEINKSSTKLYYVSVSNNLAFLGSHSYIEILDLKNPMQPSSLWVWEIPTNSGTPVDFDIVDNTFYVAGGWAGIYIYNITNPENPVKEGQFDTMDWAIDIIVRDNIAYVTMGEGGLLILDVKDHAHPKLLGKYNLQFFASRLSIIDDIAYVSFIQYDKNIFVKSGIMAINIKDPGKPEKIGEFLSDDMVTDIFASYGNLYVALAGRGLSIFKPIY